MGEHFDYWYGPPVQVCQCGHPQSLHSDLGCRVLIEYGSIFRGGRAWHERCSCRRESGAS